LTIRKRKKYGEVGWIREKLTLSSYGQKKGGGDGGSSHTSITKKRAAGARQRYMGLLGRDIRESLKFIGKKDTRISKTAFGERKLFEKRKGEDVKGERKLYPARNVEESLYEREGTCH